MFRDFSTFGGAGPGGSSHSITTAREYAAENKGVHVFAITNKLLGQSGGAPGGFGRRQQTRMVTLTKSPEYSSFTDARLDDFKW